MTVDEPITSAFFTKLTTFTLWAIVSLSVAGWGLKLWPIINTAPLSISAQSAQSAVFESQGANASGALSPSVGTLLGAENKTLQKAPDMALARLSLVGLIQTGDDQGVALISIDGQTPKPYRIGSKVGDSLVLSSVEEKGVSFQAGLRLELPKKYAAQPSGSINVPKNPAQVGSNISGGLNALQNNSATNKVPLTMPLPKNP